MLEDVTNIEDCLELLAGFRKGSDQFQLFKAHLLLIGNTH
jgi:hypothetical protein